MNVLMISGDKTFGPGHPRFELQKSAVDALEFLYWGKGSVWPKVPKGRFDVVTVQDPFWRGAFAWCVARRIGARFNVQVHTDLAGQGLVRHILAQIVLRHADSVRVVSQKIKAQVERFSVRVPVRVLPMYIDIEKFKTVVRQPHEGAHILWIGRFEHEKDPLRAIDILKKVRDEGIDARLTMLGAGSMEGRLRQSAAGLPIAFPGWQDPRAYLATADMVLSTSPYESFGASIVEALAAGVPAVSLDVGVAKEAGALVTSREQIISGIVEVLRCKTQGVLRLTLPSSTQWALQWRETLI